MSFWTWGEGSAGVSVGSFAWMVSGEVGASGTGAAPSGLASLAWCSGAGASSPYGGAGNAKNVQGTGNNATGIGSGGGGGCCLNNGGNVAGGTGSGGLIFVEEYE